MITLFFLLFIFMILIFGFIIDLTFFNILFNNFGYVWVIILLLIIFFLLK